MKTRPTLSVLMSNYNHAEFLPNALDGILGQTYRPLEVLIVDDASTDNSVAILQEYQANNPDLIRVIRNDRNCGVVRNIKRLVYEANGDYGFFTAADDRILPGFLERSMALLEKYPEAGVCSTLSRIVTRAGAPNGILKMPLVRKDDGFIPPTAVPATYCKHGNWLLGHAAIYRRAAMVEVGGFCEELGPYTDAFLGLLLALKHGACFIPEPLVAWRRMPGTYSNRSSRDPDAILKRLSVAEGLMRSEYRPLFSDDLIREWKREMYFGAAAGLVGLDTPAPVATVERLIPAESFADRMFYGLGNAFPTFWRRIARPYLFLRLRPSHVWRAIRHRLQWLRPEYRFGD